MKTKIILLIGAVALVTLSFTFASIDAPLNKDAQKMTSTTVSEPVGGFIADEVAK